MSRDRGYRFLDPAALARVKNLSLVARGVVEGFITRPAHPAPTRGSASSSPSTASTRPGDNPRHLDWRILGRTDRLYIKQYEEETNLRVQILLDTSGSMAYGESAGDHQARIRLLPDGGAGLPDDAAAGRRGADDVRHRGPARHARAELAAALRRDDEAPGGDPARADRPTWARPSTAWPTGSSAAA